MPDTLDQNTEGRYDTPYSVTLREFFDASQKVKYIERILLLPDRLIRVLFDFKIAEFIEEDLGPRFNLSEEQKKELTKIIRDILLSDLSINQLPQKIQEKTKVNQNEAGDITKELLTKVFAPVLSDLKRMQPPPPAPPLNNQNNVLDLRNKNNS
ncbi:MAG: hypothetical protein Q7S32_03480 [bacterium]|nr:hypothetical protein [bacterium]